MTGNKADGKKILFHIFGVAEDNIYLKLNKVNLEFAKFQK